MHHWTRFAGPESDHLGQWVEGVLRQCEDSVARPGRAGGSAHRDCCYWKTRQVIFAEAHPPRRLLAGEAACSSRFAPLEFGDAVYQQLEPRRRRTRRIRSATALAEAASSSLEGDLPAQAQRDAVAVDKGDPPGRSWEPGAVRMRRTAEYLAGLRLGRRTQE